MTGPRSSQYISRKTVAESYRPHGLMSPGLQRARAPYRWKNAISGLILGAIGVGIYSYSINAVKQDKFDDVDEEARELRESGVVLTSLEDEERDRKKAAAGAHEDELILEKIVHEPPETPKQDNATRGTMPLPRGVWVKPLDRRFPWLLDPERKTLVWGAPHVDNMGRVNDPSEPGTPRK